MGFLNRIDRHSELFQTMAETVGVDLGEALFRGKLPPERLRGAVFTCIGCEGAAECPGWLADHATGAAEAPTYCRNRTLLAGLQAS